MTTVIGAFATALPGKIPAAYYGVSYVYAFNAHEADGSRRVYFDLEVGAGARIRTRMGRTPSPAASTTSPTHLLR